MRSQTILPVILSILIIILIAILERHSRFVAAITATMPLGAPLALWIVYASAKGEPGAVTEFSFGMLIGVLPTLGYLLVAWLAAREGWRLVPILLSGFGAWGIGLIILVTLKRIFGVT